MSRRELSSVAVDAVDGRTGWEADGESLQGRHGRYHRPQLRSQLGCDGNSGSDFNDASKEAHLLATRLGAEKMLVEGAGHYPHVEMPETVGPAIAGFMRRLR